MLHQVGDVEPLAYEHVTLPEGIVIAPIRRVEPFFDLDVNLPIDVFQTPVARSVRPHVRAALDQQHSIRAAYLQMDVRRFWKADAFEGLDRNLVVEKHPLATASQEAPDIDFMRTCHDD